MHTLLFLAAVLTSQAEADSTTRTPVLSQVKHPHSYYWREMYLPQPHTGPGQLAFTPDGKQLIYSAAGSLWRQPLDSDERWQLTDAAGYDSQPDVSPDGKFIYFSRAQGDARELWQLDLTSGTETQLTQDKAVALEPRVSPDGKALLFSSSRAKGYFNLYLADITDAGINNIRPLIAQRDSQIERYYYGKTDHAINGSWSADGKTIYSLANPETAWGSGDIWAVDVDKPGAPRKILSEETTWAARPEQAPEGKRLLYSGYQGRQWHQLWLATPEGQYTLPLTFGEHDLRYARWSPNGKQIAYISNELGHNSLWLQTVAGGERHLIKAEKEHTLRAHTRVTLSLKDSKGKPLAGRVLVQDQRGRHYGALPDGNNNGWLHGDDGFIPAQQTHENHYFHCQQRCSLQLPEGQYQITALNGFGKKPTQQSLRVQGKSLSIALTLKDFSLPEKFGQFLSADLHLHMNYGGHYRQQKAGLAAQMQAEDLDVGYNLIVNKEQRIPDIGEFSTEPYHQGSATIFQGQEYHTSFWGHLGLLHLDDHYLTPDFAAYQHTALSSPWPHNGVISELAHQQNALVGYVHPFDWDIKPPSESKLSHSLPADVALGHTDYLEVVSFADHKATAAVWYKLLNLGFRLAAGAGTDAMTNYANLRGPVGLNRVFLDTQLRAPEALKAAIKQGRGFVSNGPLLGLLVNGKKPGEQLTIPAAGAVKVELALRSIAPLSELELVYNGQVVKSLKAGQQQDLTLDLPVTQSGWLLLRAAGQPHETVQDLYPYASTNPVWLDVAGQPQARATGDAAYFVAWLDRVIDAAAARTDYLTPEERQATLDYLAQARHIYQQKATEDTP